MENPMKTIRRVALAIVIALIFVAGVNAQDSCKVKVLIAAFNWNNADDYRKDFMSLNQTDWWLKEGQKKFPGICITTEKNEADYLIAWTATESSDKYTYTVPKTETTEHRGTVNTNSSSRSTSSPDTVHSSGCGTYRGTSTTTTYERKEGEWPVVYVNAFVHRMTKDGSDKPYVKTPLFIHDQAQGTVALVKARQGRFREVAGVHKQAVEIGPESPHNYRPPGGSWQAPLAGSILSSGGALASTQ
jgi:hypothetical protein